MSADNNEPLVHQCLASPSYNNVQRAHIQRPAQALQKIQTRSSNRTQKINPASKDDYYIGYEYLDGRRDGNDDQLL